MVGDLASKGAKWRAYHWILEDNQLKSNRWGIYAKHADWIATAGNRFENNQNQDVLLDDVTRWIESKKVPSTALQVSKSQIDGPTSVAIGQPSTWNGSVVAEANTDGPVFTWDLGDREFRTGSKLTHTFDRIGFHRLGLNVTNGDNTELAWQDVYVVRNGAEIGTEGQANEWSLEDFDERGRRGLQTSRAEFSNDPKWRLMGQSSLGVVIRPYSGFRAAVQISIKDRANQALTGKTKLTCRQVCEEHCLVPSTGCHLFAFDESSSCEQQANCSNGQRCEAGWLWNGVQKSSDFAASKRGAMDV